jgi:hypothetical protein
MNLSKSHESPYSLGGQTAIENRVKTWLLLTCYSLPILNRHHNYVQPDYH